MGKSEKSSANDSIHESDRLSTLTAKTGDSQMTEKTQYIIRYVTTHAAKGDIYLTLIKALGTPANEGKR